MAFENPILAGEELIRSAIKSEDYEEGRRGWRIARDGTVEFQNIVNRGNASFEDLGVSTFTVGGKSIEELLRPLPKGTVGKWTGNTPASRAAGQGRLGLFEVAIYLEAGRFYMFTVSLPHRFDDARCEGRVFITNTFAFDGNPPSPTIDSPVMYSRQFSDNEPLGYDKEFMSQGWYRPGSNGIHRFLVGITAAGTGTFTIVNGTGTIAASSLRIDDMGVEALSNVFGQPSTGGAVAEAPPPVVAPKIRYDNTWWNTDVQSYRSDGNFTVATNGGNVAYQGDGSAVGNPGGNHCGFFTFDAGSIRANLAGATILESYIFLDNEHSYLSGGVEAVIGTHNNEGIPGSAVNRFENRWRQSVGKGGEFWTGNLGGGLGNEFRDGGTRGVMVGYGFNGINHYSRFNRAAVRFVYEK